MTYLTICNILAASNNCIKKRKLLVLIKFYLHNWHYRNACHIQRIVGQVKWTFLQPFQDQGQFVPDGQLEALSSYSLHLLYHHLASNALTESNLHNHVPKEKDKDARAELEFLLFQWCKSMWKLFRALPPKTNVWLTFSVKSPNSACKAYPISSNNWPLLGHLSCCSSKHRLSCRYSWCFKFQLLK